VITTQLHSKSLLLSKKANGVQNKESHHTQSMHLKFNVKEMKMALINANKVPVRDVHIMMM
jgi:hypothetical protein